MTPRLKTKERCRNTIAGSHKQTFQMWRLSSLNIEQECLNLLYMSVSGPYFYMQTQMQTQTVISNMQKTQNRAQAHILFNGTSML